MTHGDMWRDAITRRIEGYCKTRGFRSNGPFVVRSMFPMSRVPQYEYDIRDARGNIAVICVEMYAEQGTLIDENGRAIDHVNAVAFDTLTERLVRRTRPDKNQLHFGV